MLFNFSILFFTNFMSVFRRTHKKACLSAHEHICSNATQVCVCVLWTFWRTQRPAAVVAPVLMSFGALCNILLCLKAAAHQCAHMHTHAFIRRHIKAGMHMCSSLTELKWILWIITAFGISHYTHTPTDFLKSRSFAFFHFFCSVLTLNTSLTFSALRQVNALLALRAFAQRG